MEECENLLAEYRYDLNELISFVKTLLIAAEQEETELTHEDIVHNTEILQEKLIRLNDKITLLQDKMFCCS